MKQRARTQLLIGAVVVVLGIAFAIAMLGGADIFERRAPGDQGWAALSLLGVFGGLAIVGTGLSVLLRGGYMWVFGEEPPEE